MMIRDRIKELRRVPAGELLPNPKNWRTHPQSQQDALRGILAEIGYADALLTREVDGQRLMLIDGHLRAETTPDSIVPVLVLDVTDAEADKILATLDPLAAMAEADAGKLDALLREVQTSSEGLAAMLTELAEANGVIPGGAPVPGAGGDEFDTGAALEGECRVAGGDLWVIGEQRHRLLCGDSTRAEDVARVMGGEKAGLCFTSPPYAQQREYTKEITDWDGLMRGVFANLPMSDAGQVLVNLGLVHRDGEWWPYWDGWIEWMRAQGWRRFAWHVWDQGPGLPGDWAGRLAPAFEFVYHFNRRAMKPQKTQECKYAGEIQSKRTFRNPDGSLDGFTHTGKPVQTHKIPDSVIRIVRKHGVSDAGDHPAVFPIDLPLLLLEAWPGDVYDPFLGSGTSIIAAHRTGRRCCGIELEPRYCEVVLRRCEAEGLTVQKV